MGGRHINLTDNKIDPSKPSKNFSRFLGLNHPIQERHPILQKRESEAEIEKLSLKQSGLSSHSEEKKRSLKSLHEFDDDAQHLSQHPVTNEKFQYDMDIKPVNMDGTALILNKVMEAIRQIADGHNHQLSMVKELESSKTEEMPVDSILRERVSNGSPLTNRLIKTAGVEYLDQGKDHKDDDKNSFTFLGEDSQKAKPMSFNLKSEAGEQNFNDENNNLIGSFQKGDTTRKMDYGSQKTHRSSALSKETFHLREKIQHLEKKFEEEKNEKKELKDRLEEVMNGFEKTRNEQNEQIGQLREQLDQLQQYLDNEKNENKELKQENIELKEEKEELEEENQKLNDFLKELEEDVKK